MVAISNRVITIAILTAAIGVAVASSCTNITVHRSAARFQRRFLSSSTSRTLIQTEKGEGIANDTASSPPRPRYLVYTSVGGAAKYLQMFQFLLASLDRCVTRPAQFDFLIITDVASLPAVTAHVPQYKFSIDYMIADPLEDKAGAPPHMAVSMRKLNIFLYSKIDNYESQLFLDSDVITTFDPSTLFSLPLKPDVMYAATEHVQLQKSEPERWQLHQTHHFGLQNYTQDQLAMFKEKNTFVMNAGILLFRNTPEMKQHFINLRQLIKDYTGQYYYEQCFVNYYFNSKSLSDTALLTPFVAEPFAAGHGAYDNKLLHFLGSTFEKIRPMTKIYHGLFSRPKAQPVANQRPELHSPVLHMFLRVLSTFAAVHLTAEQKNSWWSHMGHAGQVPKQVRAYRHLASQPDVRTICEIGFNAGHSTAVLMSANPGAVLYSFDTMELPYSQKMYELFKHIYPSRFYAVQGSSFETVPWLHSLVPTLTCDLFSVDGDLSHDGLLTDMLNAIAMMPVNATILVDDVTDRFPGRKQAWQEVLAAGYLSDPVCEVPDTALHVTVGEKGWCYAKIANTTGSLMPVHRPAVKDWYKFE